MLYYQSTVQKYFLIFQTMADIVCYTDGASRGNPGESSLGVYIETLDRGYGERLGIMTNNEAEYSAIVYALTKIKALIGKSKAKMSSIEVRMDSELACKQLNHIYKIENAKLQPLFLAVWNLMLDYGEVRFVHVRRELNTKADALGNRALDERADIEQLL